MQFKNGTRIIKNRGQRQNGAALYFCLQIHSSIACAISFSVFPRSGASDDPICRVYKVSAANGGVYRGDGVCCALRCNKPNKGGYAHLLKRGAEIPGRAKNDSAAV